MCRVASILVFIRGIDTYKRGRNRQASAVVFRNRPQVELYSDFFFFTFSRQLQALDTTDSAEGGPL